MKKTQGARNKVFFCWFQKGVLACKKHYILIDIKCLKVTYQERSFDPHGVRLLRNMFFWLFVKNLSKINNKKAKESEKQHALGQRPLRFFLMMVGNVICKAESFEDEFIYSFHYKGKGFANGSKPRDSCYVKQSRCKHTIGKLKHVCRTFPKEDRRKQHNRVIPKVGSR